jgi:hypothetical protein
VSLKISRPRAVADLITSDPIFATVFDTDIIESFDPNFDGHAGLELPGDAEAEVDHESRTSSPRIKDRQDLLSFQVNQSSRCPVLDSSHNSQFVDISAQLSGMFFVAESPWKQSSVSEFLSSQPVLTCYRRNLFRIGGTIRIPRNFATALGPRGFEEAIDSISVELSATENFQGASAKIVSVSAKNASNSSDVLETGPPPIKLDFGSNPDRHSDPCPFSFSWDRLRFRSATAKNNRRAALQQHYTMNIRIISTLKDASQVLLCESTSVPVIVRGRSPGSYLTSRSVATVPAPAAPQNRLIQQHTSIEHQPATSIESNQFFKRQSIPLPSPSQQGPQQLEIEQSEFSAEALFTSESITPSRTTQPSRQAENPTWTSKTITQDIHLDQEQEFATSEDNIHPRSRPATSPEENENLIEDSELSYEYFPLSIDDWTVPVEAVYVSHSKCNRIKEC